MKRQLSVSRQVASGAEGDSPPGIQDQAHHSPCPRVLPPPFLPALPLAPSWGGGGSTAKSMSPSISSISGASAEEPEPDISAGDGTLASAETGPLTQTEYEGTEGTESNRNSFSSPLPEQQTSYFLPLLKSGKNVVCSPLWLGIWLFQGSPVLLHVCFKDSER